MWSIVIGAVSGALGLFLALLSCILNFNKKPAVSAGQPKPAQSNASISVPRFGKSDDSRYMPKA